VDNKLENIVISPKRCHILAHFEHLAYDNKKPVNAALSGEGNNIVRYALTLRGYSILTPKGFKRVM
jgi:hypothetical protein